MTLVAITPDSAASSGHAATLDLLRLPDRPTAVVAGSDSLAIGSIRAARELDLAVTADVAVVGNDGISSAARTLATRSSLSLSEISSPETSTVTECSEPLNLNGVKRPRFDAATFRVEQHGLGLGS